jgi:hypothetical protein
MVFQEVDLEMEVRTVFLEVDLKMVDLDLSESESIMDFLEKDKMDFQLGDPEMETPMEDKVLLELELVVVLAMVDQMVVVTADLVRLELESITGSLEVESPEMGMETQMVEVDRWELVFLVEITTIQRVALVMDITMEDPGQSESPFQTVVLVKDLVQAQVPLEALQTE